MIVGAVVNAMDNSRDVPGSSPSTNWSFLPDSVCIVVCKLPYLVSNVLSHVVQFSRWNAASLLILSPMHTTLFDWNPIICKQLQKFIYFLPPSQVLYSQYPGWKCTIAFQWCTVQYCQCDRRRQSEVRGPCLLAMKFFHFDHWSDQKSGFSPLPGNWKMAGEPSLEPPEAFPWSHREPSPGKNSWLRPWPWKYSTDSVT